jgi:hypothetical protein
MSPDRLNLQPELDTVESAPPVVEEFRSILFGGEQSAEPPSGQPLFFPDLNLDRVVEAIVAGRDEYELTAFFHLPLRNVPAIEYRQEVFRDLESGDVAAAVRAFAAEMQRVRRFLTLAEKQRNEHEKERWFADAAALYGDCVVSLHDDLVALEPSSRGFQALRDYLSAYVASERFVSVEADLETVLAGLAGVTYAVRVRGAHVTVTRYRGERDYSVEVEEMFERFRQGAPDNHLIEIPDSGSMDHVEARIVELVARLFPDEFAALSAFRADHSEFIDPRIARFDREVQFYLAYLEHTKRVAPAGVLFSFPTVATDSKQTAVEHGCDIALAAKLAAAGEQIVCNDFFLDGPERILVVSGPNQGGKTTFARAFGQLHYLASLGVPVPAARAQLFLADRVFTHFEREEDIRTLHGKLDDELVRIREILEQATGKSVVVLNEAFSSTTLSDAVYLGTAVLGQLVDLGCLGVWVTFVDELASSGETTASMVAQVAPHDPTHRTFKVLRQPADGRAYAWALAEKFGLSHDRLQARLGR